MKNLALHMHAQHREAQNTVKCQGSSGARSLVITVLLIVTISILKIQFLTTEMALTIGDIQSR